MNSFSLHRVFIGLGSNLGDREHNLQSALSYFNCHEHIDLIDCSAFRETAPWGVLDQPRFINAVAMIRTSLSPFDLLADLKQAERILGRLPSDFRWGPRVIDLDILLYGEEILNSSTLTIPHACLTERIFVMEQIVELDAAAEHPLYRRTISSLLMERKKPLVNSVE
jgi:2-amino-4-hydroxy-6-hydroxymethyldihydropteridine diphosphokinase